MGGGTTVDARRLVSRDLRAFVVALIIAAVALAAVLAFGFAGTSVPGRLDRAIDNRLIAHFGSRTRLVRALADLGSPAQMVVITVLFVAALILLRRPRGAVLAACSSAVASAITEWVLKPFDRAYADLPAYPSGHATAFCAATFVVIVVVLDQTRPRLPRPLQAIVVVVALGLAASVMAALVAARYHFATDVLGGACVALAVVLSLALAIDWLADVRIRSRSV